MLGLNVFGLYLAVFNSFGIAIQARYSTARAFQTVASIVYFYLSNQSYWHTFFKYILKCYLNDKKTYNESWLNDYAAYLLTFILNLCFAYYYT